ncbi:hypothetical protein NQ317_009602 [Molorchus minor]|uniref:Uncharacterized protein n=1 Tax=Molorchus minor TaxID=1323400 RepID=A0ABQ9IUE7_9CUCU|nr:hypothetical protein NQ317_009602 [Molorchus minor]
MAQYDPKYNGSYRKRNRKKFELQISTEEDEYEFVVSLIEDKENEKDDSPYPTVHNEDENILLLVQEISVKGYKKAANEELGILHLKSFLKSLSQYHANSIKQGHFRSVNQGHILPKVDYNCLYNLTDNIGNIIDTKMFEDGLSELFRSSHNVLEPRKDNVYVYSCILRHKLFFRKTDNEQADCKIIKTAQEKFLPLVYDVLLAVFFLSSQRLRQHHFHDLLVYYYGELHSYCADVEFDLSKVLPAVEFQNQVRIFLPYVKLELAHHYCNKYLENSRNQIKLNSVEKKYKDLILSSILEVYECILYPNLAREEFYSILESKNDATDFLRFLVASYGS